MKYVRIEANSTTQVESARRTDDPWDKDDTITEWTFGSLYLDNEDSHRYTIPVADDRLKRGDLCYVVVAVWTVSDSFSVERGRYMELMDVFKVREDAEALVEKYENGPTNGLPWHGCMEHLCYAKVIHGVLG